MITACESVLQIERVFVNKNSKRQDGDNLLVLVTNKDEYALYRGRMDLVRKDNLSMWENQKITCAEFDTENTCFWLATERGMLLCFSVETGKLMGEAYNASPEIPKPITNMRHFCGIDNDNIFLIILDQTDAVIYSQKRGDSKPVIYGEDDKSKALQGKPICNVRVAYNGKFFCLGIPS